MRYFASIYKARSSQTRDCGEMDDGLVPILRLAEQVMDDFAELAIPGAFLVDIFPFCEFVLFTLQSYTNPVSIQYVTYQTGSLE